ncbi:hypothetical protein Tco_0972931 [Tanacetum coccineum]
MSSNSNDIQEASSDTRPPMLDRTNYESWSQRIRLYCRGKENGLQILQLIDEGPFELGTTRNTLGTTPEGGVLLGPIRPHTYDDLSDTEKKRYDADVRSELTKEDRESQLYDEFERFKMLPGENINEYYVRFHKLVNDMRNIKMTMPNIQLNYKNQNQRYFARGNGAAGNGGAQNRAGNAKGTNSDYFKDKMLLMQAQENGAALNEEELLFLTGEHANTFDADVDNKQSIDMLMMNWDAQSIFMANLSSAGVPDLGTVKVITYEQYLSVDNISVVPSCPSSALNDVCVSFDNYAFVPHDPIATELKIYKEQVAIYEQHDKNSLEYMDVHDNDAFESSQPSWGKMNLLKIRMLVGGKLIQKLRQKGVYERAFRHAAWIGRKFNPVSWIHTHGSVTSKDNEVQLGIQVSRQENSQDITSLWKRFGRLYFRGNTICELKEKISRLTKKNNDADPIFDLKALVSQNKDLTAELNSLHDLNEHFRAENAKVKQHYKELYDSIKITCAQTTDQNNSLLSEIENLKAQLKDNSKCVTIPDSKPKVLAPGSCEIANSSICIFPRVKFSPHDPIVHHSGHDIKRRVKVNVSSSLVGKVSKYSATGSTVIAPSPSLGPSSWGSSSSRINSMNITSSSSSLKLELVFSRLPSSYSTLGSLSWDSSGCLGWIAMALIELWICVEHCGSIIGLERADETGWVPNFGFLTVLLGSMPGN